MTEKRARAPACKLRIPYFERQFTPVKPIRARARFKTIDDVVFEVCDASVVPSTYMHRRVSGLPSNNQPPTDPPFDLPNVAADVFETVMRYCYFHTSRYCESLLPNEVKDWDDQFMHLDPRQLCELASAAYYLDVKDLIELACRAIAAIISGKTAEQIRKTFHIENDLAGTIDRILPRAARRQVADPQMKPSNNTDQENDPQSQSNETQPHSHNNSAQKTVDELTEWINASSTKAKKKKKKRHKEKHAAKQKDEPTENDMLPLIPPPEDTQTSRLATDHDAKAAEEETDAQQDCQSNDVITNHSDETSLPSEENPLHQNTSLRKNDIVGGEAQSLNSGNSSTPQVSSLKHTAQSSDVHSSDSDIVFVSEKLVGHSSADLHEADSQTKQNGKTHITTKTCTGQPNNQDSGSSSQSHPQHLKNDTPAIAASDSESVQWVPPSSAARTRGVKAEQSNVESSQINSEPSEGDTTGPNHSTSTHTGDTDLDRATNLFLGGDVVMEDLESDSTLYPAGKAGQASGEAYIDCPENMDREVEEFQKRLCIDESTPLDSANDLNDTPSNGKRNVNRVGPTSASVGSPAQAAARTNDRSSIGRLVVVKNENETKAGKSGNHAMKSKGPMTSDRAMDEAHCTSHFNTTNEDCDRAGASRGSLDEAPLGRTSDAATTPHISKVTVPQEVVKDFFRLCEKKKCFEKRGSEIDREVANLSMERARVTDQLTSIDVQMMQIRHQYSLPDTAM